MKGLIKLKELREKAGITQQELADKLFISAQSVSKWENGLSEPDLGTVCCLADLFEVSTDTLLNKEPSFKNDVEDRLQKYLTGSESFSDNLFDILRASVSARLNGNKKYDTYSYLNGKNKILAFSNRTNMPRIALLADNLGITLKDNKNEFIKDLCALADDNTIAIVSALEKLDGGIDYDATSLCSILNISKDVFVNAADNLILIGAICKYELKIDNKDISVYRRCNLNKILSIYALVDRLFTGRPDGSTNNF